MSSQHTDCQSLRPPTSPRWATVDTASDKGQAPTHRLNIEVSVVNKPEDWPKNFILNKKTTQQKYEVLF